MLHGLKLRQDAAVDFSAQFGGRDAADAVLPHFRALKAAREGIVLPAFPFSELAFVLRVDGEVSTFEFSGVGEPEIDSKGRYLAIDIGIGLQDRGDITAVITGAISDSLEIIEAAISGAGIGDFNAATLRPQLNLLCESYQRAMAKS